MNKKVYKAVMSGKSDKNINFKDLCNLITALGGVLKRQNGSHRLYELQNGERLNIQSDGANAKPYQVKQLRDAIKRLA